jgi:hypothetical protein
MTLIEFGYHRDDAIYALRIYSNNIELASSYLIGNPNPVTEPRGSNRHHRRRNNAAMRLELRSAANSISAGAPRL